MATPVLFPNYTQMRQAVPLRVWHLLRLLSVAAALALIVALLVVPKLALTIWWSFVLPVLPLLFFIAPGLWRNICPMAALNQTPRLFGFSRGVALPRWLREYGIVIGLAIFFIAVPARKALFNDNGPATALLLVAALGAAFAGGLVFKGKGGWCSSGVCPLFPVQRLYGQEPFVVIPNSHCQPCVGCAKNCYDFNPRVAYLTDMQDEDRRYTGLRRFFAGAFPGMILAFYTVPSPPAISTVEMYGRFALAMLAGAGLYWALDVGFRRRAATIAAGFGAAALFLYYWFTIPRVFAAADLAVPDVVVWALRAVVLALALWWMRRVLTKEGQFAAQQQAALPVLSVAASRSIAARRAGGLGQPEVRFPNEKKQVVVEKGRTLLEVIEKNGLRIESGCRMGVCGADPVAVLDGLGHCSPINDDERNTLERLGFAANTRMACVARVLGDVAVALKPERPQQFSSSVVRGASRDPSVNTVVIIGNGIAGVTVADHLRRRHPMAEIHLVAKERHHLYNRMAIERVIYGRTAMDGLYLQDPQWYSDLAITTWLNTRATAIDRTAHTVTLGTGDTLSYDRLILATGGVATLPPIDGWGMSGGFVLREADDAFAIRAYAQEVRCTRAMVAGGGLLGLEAAHALHKLGLEVAVLERGPWLLRRQLDQTGARYLQSYLENLGIEIITGAETQAVSGNGRTERVHLKDGRDLPCDVLLVAAGVTPNVELAKAAGLDTGRGVRVDDFLRTSDPHIYAAGDVAEHHGIVHGLWPVAAEQAQVVAVNALGGERRFIPTPAVTMLKVVGVDLTSAGRFEAEDEADQVIAFEEEAERRYRKLVIRDGRVVGAILFGFPSLAPAVSSALKRRSDVGAVLPQLLAGDWTVLEGLPEGPPLPEPASASAGSPPPHPASPLVAKGEPLAVQRPPERVVVQPESSAVAASPAATATPPEAPAGGAGMPSSPPVGASSEQPLPLPALTLRFLSGPLAGQELTLGPEGGDLGRALENAVPIPDQALSRRHARISYQDGAWFIEDLGSTNGTSLDQVRLSAPARLEKGSVIRLGASRVEVTIL